MTGNRGEVPMSTEAELVSFLEDFPLYRRRDFTKPKPPQEPASGTRKSLASGGQLPSEPYGFRLPEGIKIVMPCKTCGEVRTFVWKLSQNQLMGRILSGAPPMVMEPAATYQMQFLCAHCGKQRIAFLLGVDSVDSGEAEGFSLTKAGQWPSARPTISRSLEHALGESVVSLYKQGLTAEGHGFGIGAFAYYRRVAEDMIGKLLAELRSYAEGSGLTELVAALDSVATEQQASKRIEAVKDLLPPALRPDGMNPLATIYSAVSGGLHGETDEQCLDLASQLRTALEFLVLTIEEQKATKERYVAAMRGLQKATTKKTG
jgi:hypothetical protein